MARRCGGGSPVKTGCRSRIRQRSIVGRLVTIVLRPPRSRATRVLAQRRQLWHSRTVGSSQCPPSPGFHTGARLVASQLVRRRVEQVRNFGSRGELEFSENI